MEAVAELAAANARIDAKAEAVVKAETELHDARAAYRDAFATALKAGWTAAELAQTGNPAERGQDTRRARSSRRRNTTSTMADPAPAPATPSHTPGPAELNPVQHPEPMPVAGD